MKKYSNKIIIGVAIFILFLFGFFFLFRKTASKENSLPVLQNQAQTSKAVIEIENIKYEEEITANETVYDFMAKLEQERKISFKEKNYIGMREFITGINGLENNGSESWIYYVNGKQASVGVSNYKLKNNDMISWKYEKNIY